jgi:CBS domain containing-hemolysin-like protein
MLLSAYIVGVCLLVAGLAVVSYFDRVYRDLGRAVTPRTRKHLEEFEIAIEPRLHIERRRGAVAFAMLARFWLVLVAVETTRGILYFVPGVWESVVEMVFLLGIEVVFAMQFIPSLLVVRAPGRWSRPLVPAMRLLMWIVWPLQAILELAISFLNITEESEEEFAEPLQQEIGDIVDAATEEGIIEHDEARLIEQVVEFGDKRVSEVMTNRADIVAVQANATLEQLRQLVVEAKFSRIPVYEKNIDDIAGIVVARDILKVPDREASQRLVRELIRPALFVPETKLGSELLKEMQRKNQQMAIVIDEYGLMAGIVTIEDLVEEILGEIGEEDRVPVPDVVREPSGAMVLRGSLSLDKVQDLFGVDFSNGQHESNASTLAGLLNSVTGHVPAMGEKIDFGGLQFEVLEANQRKVLRLRANRRGGATARA